MNKIVTKTEKTITTKQVADALGTSVKVIIENAIKCLPNKIIENGKYIYNINVIIKRKNEVKKMEIYTTEKLLSSLKEAGYKAIKKINKNTIEYDRLQRHIPTEISGKIYNCFNDYVNYKVVEYLHDNNIEAFINDDNQIELYLDDKEQLEINRKLYTFLKEEHII